MKTKLDNLGMNLEIHDGASDPNKDFGHNIVAILNEKGMQEKEFAFEDFSENMYVESLTYAETEFLFKTVFNPLFNEYQLLIDYYEEEEIPNKCLARTLELANKAEKTAKSEVEKSAAEKMLKIAQKAVDCGTCILVYL